MTNVGLGTALSRSLVVSLAADCGVASELARFIVDRPVGSFDCESVTFTSRSVLKRIAEDFVRRSWLTAVQGGWRVGPLTFLRASSRSWRGLRPCGPMTPTGRLRSRW